MAAQDAISLLSLFLPRTTTTTSTQKTSTSKEGVKAATDNILQQLIPHAAATQQAAGGFGSSAYSLMVSDAAAKAAAYSEELNKTVENTQTVKQNAALDPRLGLALWGANALANSEYGKKAGKSVSDWFSGLFGDSGGAGTSTDSPSFNLSFGGGSAGSAGEGVGQLIPGLMDTFSNLFKADGGRIQGDQNESYKAMWDSIKNNISTITNNAIPTVPTGGGNMGDFSNNFEGYGEGVKRDYGKEFGGFLKVGQGILTGNPAVLATGITNLARYDAQQRLLQGFAENNPEQIQAAADTLENIQTFSDTFGVIGKVKGVVDGVSNLGNLSDMFSAAPTIAGKGLVTAIAGDQAVTTANDAMSLMSRMSSGGGGGDGSDNTSSDPVSGDSSDSVSGDFFGGFFSLPNYSWNRLGGGGGGDDPTGGTGWADGGFIGAGHQTDLKGKDRVKANLSGGEYIIPTDVVSKLGAQFFDELVASLHKTTRG